MAGSGNLVGPFPRGVDPTGYDRMRRRVLWQLPMGLYLLGTAAGDRKNMMTLNWAMQVSVRPKQVAVSVETSAVSHELLVEGGCFALSLIPREERAAVRKFVKPAKHDPGEMTLNAFGYTISSTGAPIASIATSWLDCEVRQTIEAGSHSVFVGEVVAAGGGGKTPILRMEDTQMSYGG
ncbi:MAG: flavin reductase family protein [Acidimicrobiales bacterium]